MKVKSEREVAQSSPTLSDPVDCSLSGSSIHGIFQARVLEWGAIAFSDMRMQTTANKWVIFIYLEVSFGMYILCQQSFMKIPGGLWRMKILS